MSKTRPNYPLEYREKILDLYRSGRSVASLARDFEPSQAAIRKWIAQARQEGNVRPEKLAGSEREELELLRKEVRILREEREILKKAAAWFAQESGTRSARPSK